MSEDKLNYLDFEATKPKSKGFEERIIELIKDDPELHDATVKLIESFAELKHEQAMRMKGRRTHIDQVR